MWAILPGQRLHVFQRVVDIVRTGFKTMNLVGAGSLRETHETMQDRIVVMLRRSQLGVDPDLKDQSVATT